MNFVHETLVMSSDRVMRWSLLLEEYRVTWCHIPGDKNILADFLSRYPTYEDNFSHTEAEECCAVTPHQEDFPLLVSRLATYQQRDKRKSDEFNKFYEKINVDLVLRK